MATPKYSKEDVELALADINNGMSVFRASQIYKIPKMTLLYKKSGKHSVDKEAGIETALSQAEEFRLENCILEVAKNGFSVTTKGTRECPTLLKI